LTAWVGGGAKPTVVAVLLAGAVTAAVASLLVRRAVPNRASVAAVVGLAVVLALSMAGQNSTASRITLLGSLRSNRVYSELIPATSLRAVNDGWLLDSLDDRRALLAALVALVVLLGFHAIRWIGFGVLIHPSTRRDLAGWLLAGAVVGGWFAFLVLDHIGYSQAYFVHTAVPAGALLTAWLLVVAVGDRSFRVAAPAAMAGLGAGVLAFLLADGAGRRVLELPTGGILELVVVPLVAVLAVAAAGALGWHRLRRRGLVGPLGLVVAITFTIGLAVAPAVPTIAGRLVTFVRPPAPVVDTTARSFVSAGEQHAARWLRDNSAPDDVVVTNLHCRPPSNEPDFCDARGFWLSGLSGRRSVLEGWAYTAEAQENQGVGGRTFATQPSPWPDRYELSQAAVTAPTKDVLDRLTDEFDADWIVAVSRADPISPDLADLAEVAFDNGEVAIYRLR
jgi:hypothetical protein